MEVFRRQERARMAAATWQAQYYRWGSETWDVGGLDKEAVHARLVALGAAPNPDDVDAIIGNRMWTWQHCDECNQDTETAVRLGQEPDYESATAWICLDCLRRALALAVEVPAEKP